MPVNMKRMISKELFSLIEEKGIDKVTVQLLSSRCGITRQAFYYHFKDIADVYDWTCQMLLREMIKTAVSRPDLADGLQDFLDFACHNRPILIRISESVHYYELEKRMCHYTFLFLEALLKDRWPDSLKDPKIREAFLSFYSPALFSHAMNLAGQTHPNTKKDAQSLAHLFLSDF